MSEPCDKCGWPTRPLRTPADDCTLFGVPEHDSMSCHDCWGICDALCEGCGRPVRSGTVTGAESEQIAARRGDAAFMERLRTRMAEDGPILDRLAHQHRYPKLNTAGFPVNQCLDCGDWIIAPPDLRTQRTTDTTTTDTPWVNENDPRAISLATDFMARFGDRMEDLNEDVMALWFDTAIKQATNGRVADPAPQGDSDDPVGSPPHWNAP